MKIMTFIFYLFLNSCFAQNEFKKDIKFAIVNNVVKDNTYITLLISNNSSYNYYLPILNSFESERWKFMLSTDESNFFFIYMVAYDSNGKSLKWHSDNCYGDHVIDEDLNKLYDQWQQKKKNISIKDLILLKAGDHIKIRVPINLQIKYSKDCFWEIEDFKNEKKLTITYYYRAKQSELISRFLDSQTIQNLNLMNYKLYNEEIESNKVQLTF
jgi:hypothetical protein